MLAFIRFKFNRFARRVDGSSTVELAIVFPVLLLLFIASAEMGRLFYTYTTLAKATKAGARYVSNDRDATSTDPAKVAAVKLKAQSLVICGYTDCTNRTPIVAGLTPANNVTVSIFTQTEGTVNVKYVKVAIQGYAYSPGVFNLASRLGQQDSAFYFALTPSNTMRYLL